MTLMITPASAGGLPAAGIGEAASTDGSAGDAFAGVLAGIPDTAGRPADPKSDRRPAERAGKQAEESDVELAAMAGPAGMALLAPAVPAVAMLALQADLGPGTAAEPPAGDPGEPAAGRPAVGLSAVTRTALAGTALPNTAPTSTAVPGAAPVNTPATWRPAAADGLSQLPNAGASPTAGDPAGHPEPGEDLGHSLGRTYPLGIGSGDRAGSGRQAGAGNGLGPVKAMGPAHAADAAQAAAAAKIFQDGGSAAPPTEASAAAISIEPVDPKRPVPGGVKPAIGVTLPGGLTMPTMAGVAGAPGLAAVSGSVPAGGAQAPGPTAAMPASAVLGHRAAKSPAGASGNRAPEPGQLPAGVPSEPLSAASPSSAAAMQQVPAQPVPAGQQLAVTGGHSRQQGHSQPPSMAHPPVAHQVAAPLLALRASGDGSHQLIVALHPAELGPVNVHVRIEGDLMTIQLASNNETAHDTLRDALPQLRSELQSAGLGGVALSLDLASGGAPGSGAFADPRQASGDPARPVRAAPASEPTSAPARHRTSGGRIGIHSSSGLDRWL